MYHVYDPSPTVATTKKKKKRKEKDTMTLKEPKTLCILNINFFLFYVQYLEFWEKKELEAFSHTQIIPYIL